MKSNIPEKVYIGVVPSDLGNSKYTTVNKEFPDAVEYTRTDVLIEKAAEYLGKEQIGFILTYKDVNNFVKYMKEG